MRAENRLPACIRPDGVGANLPTTCCFVVGLFIRHPWDVEWRATDAQGEACLRPVIASADSSSGGALSLQGKGGIWSVARGYIQRTSGIGGSAAAPKGGPLLRGESRGKMGEDYAIQEGFKLGRPALVCRWRLANKRLPMANRHLRALAARELGGERVSMGLVAWAKQHIEWTLEDGSTEYPDGVLMIIVDDEGQAAMTVGPFEELKRRNLSNLLARARGARRECSHTKVAPETLWAVKGDELVFDLPKDSMPSGASTLVDDLARTIGMPVCRSENLLARVLKGNERFDELFLVSDEFGVVPAEDAGGQRALKFAGAYQKLLSSMKG